MKRITSSQRQINLIIIIVAGVFFVLWIFIYLPRKGNLNRLESNLKNIKQQIKQIERIVVGHQMVDEGISLFEKRAEEIDSKFPAKEEESLGLLSDIARQLDIEMVSIKSQPKTFFLDEDDKRVKIEGKTYQRVLVSIEMKSSYENLLEYIEELKDSLPAYITVERLRISKNIAGTSKILQVSLDLYLNLLS